MANLATCNGTLSRRKAQETASSYLRDFSKLLARVNVEAVARVVERLRIARDSGATLYVAGNGGSASTATHLANDLGKATKRSDCKPVRVLSLSDNVSWFTALANDEGFERVFVGQLENLAKPGDVLIVISASGNSPNLVAAVDFARANDLVSIGMLGFDGGTLKDQVDECLWVESDKGAYGPVESAHSLLGHVLTMCLLREPPAEEERA